MMLTHTAMCSCTTKESLKVTDLAIPSPLFSPKGASLAPGVETEDGASFVDQDLASTFPSLLKDLDQVPLPFQKELSGGQA